MQDYFDSADFIFDRNGIPSPGVAAGRKQVPFYDLQTTLRQKKILYITIYINYKFIVW